MVAAAVVTGVVVTLLPPDVDAEGGLTVSLKKYSKILHGSTFKTLYNTQ